MGNISSGSSVYIDNSANGTYTITSQAGIDCVKACGSMFIDDNFFKGTNKDYAPCTSKCYQPKAAKIKSVPIRLWSVQRKLVPNAKCYSKRKWTKAKRTR